MVDRTAGGGDDDFDALLERADLAADRLAAEHGERADAERTGIALDGLVDLDRKLTGRDEDQGAGGAVGTAARDALEDGKSECGGLAGAGGRLAEQVAAADQRRDRLELDRGWLRVAELLQRPQDRVGQAEAVEARGGVNFVCGSRGRRIGDR